MYADFIRMTFLAVRLAPKGRDKIRSSGLSDSGCEYFSSFLRLLPRILENNARYLLLQHTWVAGGRSEQDW